MTAYTVEASAAAQLEDIYIYTVNRWGRGQAQTYVAGLTRTFRSIAERSIRGTRIPASIRVDGFVCRYQRHYVYWRVRSDGRIGIVAILHERMDQGARLRQVWRDPP